MTTVLPVVALLSNESRLPVKVPDEVIATPVPTALRNWQWSWQPARSRGRRSFSEQRLVVDAAEPEILNPIVVVPV